MIYFLVWTAINHVCLTAYINKRYTIFKNSNWPKSVKSLTVPLYWWIDKFIWISRTHCYCSILRNGVCVRHGHKVLKLFICHPSSSTFSLNNFAKLTIYVIKTYTPDLPRRVYDGFRVLPEHTISLSLLPFCVPWASVLFSPIMSIMLTSDAAMLSDKANNSLFTILSSDFEIYFCPDGEGAIIGGCTNAVSHLVKIMSVHIAIIHSVKHHQIPKSGVIVWVLCPFANTLGFVCGIIRQTHSFYSAI